MFFSVKCAKKIPLTDTGGRGRAGDFVLFTLLQPASGGAGFQNLQRWYCNILQYEGVWARLTKWLSCKNEVEEGKKRLNFSLMYLRCIRYVKVEFV